MLSKTKFLAILTMLMLTTSAFAESVQNYLCDFNREIMISGTKTYNGSSETSAYSNNAASAFKPGPGWGKTIITNYGSGWYSYYEAWAWRADGGVDNSSYLTGRTSSYDIKDYLITPVVSGNVSLYAKLYGSGGTEYVKVYACTENADGTFTVGDEIVMTNAEAVSSSAWTQISTTVAEPARLAIRVRNAGIDNFAADLAEVEYEKAMSIKAAEGMTQQPSAIDVQSDGTYDIYAYVTVTNTGECTLTPGMENYSVSLCERIGNNNAGEAYITVPIEETLEIGQTSQPIEVRKNFDYATHNARVAYLVKENLSKNTYQTNWFDLTPYESIFTFSPEKENTVLDNGLNVSFGKINEDKTVTYRVRNRGAAPLHVNSITLPAGFTADVSGEFDVPAHGEQPVVITASAATPGIFSGAMTITYSDTGTFTVNLASVVLDNSKFYWTFDNQKWPSGTLVGDSWSVTSDTNHGYSDYYASNSNSTNPTFFFTPLMHAEAGEQFAFDVAKKGTNSFLKIYVTTDRNNPGAPVKEIIASQMNNESAGGYNYKFSTFTITIPEAGDYYIGFEGGYALVNDLYGLVPVTIEHDIALTNAVLPATATVNNASEASVKVLNTLSAIEKGYTLAYHIGTQTFTVDAVDLAQNDPKTFKFAFTPHEAGEFDSWIDITLSNGEVISTEHATVTVAGEVASSEEQIGEGKSTSTTVPIRSSYANAETEMIYKAEQLGLAANTSIKNITFKGYKTSNDKKGTLKVYIANTTDETPTFTNTASMETAVAEMTELYNATYTIRKAGSASNYQPLISVDIPEGFTYTGDNLRIFLSWYSDGGWSGNDQTWKTDNVSGQVNTRNGDNSLTGTFSVNNYLPTLFLGVEKEPSTLSGTVTVLNADNTESVVAGAKVTAAAGDVEYYATTDAAGKYNMVIIQDKLTYTLTVDYSEKNLFPQEDVVEMTGASKTYDIQYEEGVDFYVNSVDLPTKGIVNNAYTANITLTNYNQTTLAAGDYKVSLIVDDEVVAENSVDAAPMEPVTVPLTFVPHAAGTVNAHIAVVAPKRDKATEDVEVTIAEESAGGETVVGTKSSNMTSGYYPFYTYDENGIAQMLYSANYLKQYGLIAGQKITSLSFKVWASTKNINNALMKAWVAVSENDNDYQPENFNKSNAVECVVMDEHPDANNYYFPATTEEEPLTLTMDLTENPIIFDGTHGIKIYTESVVGKWIMTGTQIDKDNVTTYYKGAGTSSSIEAVRTKAWPTTPVASPVLYVTTDNAKHYTGTVKYDDETPAANAQITLTSGEVVYSGVADAEGNFDITVVQHSLNYNVVATDGNLTYNGTVNLDEDDSAVEIVLINGVIVPINPEIGYATFYDSEHAVVVPEGVTANIFGYAPGWGLVLDPSYEEGTVIPAGEAVVLEGSGDALLTYTTSEDVPASAYGQNFLAGFDTDNTTVCPSFWEEMYEITGDCLYYGLTLNKESDPESVGFYWMNETGAPFVSKAHKAYLAIPTEAFAMFDTNGGAVGYVKAFPFNKDANAIKNVNVNRNDNKMFNIAGQRVNGNVKGIVIKNGKKFMVK